MNALGQSLKHGDSWQKCWPIDAFQPQFANRRALCCATTQAQAMYSMRGGKHLPTPALSWNQSLT